MAWAFNENNRLWNSFSYPFARKPECLALLSGVVQFKHRAWSKTADETPPPIIFPPDYWMIYLRIIGHMTVVINKFTQFILFLFLDTPDQRSHLQMDIRPGKRR